MRSIGWMDDTGAMVEDIVMVDVMTFPAEVQAALAIRMWVVKMEL